jgi:anti-sigma regulatory factor (Ser/Thr protein kinase)
VSDPRGASGDQRSRPDAGTPSFERRFPADADSVGAIRGALVDFVRGCGVSGTIIDAVALAVSEAATNVVVHAYDDAARGTIDVTAALANGELWVIITDAGTGLQPHRESPGLGLGLAIIARVADGVDLVKPAGGGLEVRMRFTIDRVTA